MKLLGHVYVATKCFPENNLDLLAFGSLLPETVFYTKDPALTFDEIHEGGLDLYKFCVKNYPKMCDLAIGCMTHSVKYGADSYNSLESIKLLGFEESDIKKIADALEVDSNTAKARVHNLYDLVLDYYIYLHYPNTKTTVENTKKLNKHNIAHVLSSCFKVSEYTVYENLEHLWDKYKIEYVASFEGLAYLWRSLASDLKEKDPVNIVETSQLLSYFHDKAKLTADEFISNVVDSTKHRVKQAIGS